MYTNTQSTPYGVLVHYYPGNNSGPGQAVRYIGNNTHTLPTGEHAKAKLPGINLFATDSFYFPSMDEIITRPSSGFFSRIAHWFKCIPSHLALWWRGIQITPGETPNTTGDTYNGVAIDNNKRSVGQSTDIAEFIKSHRAIKADTTLQNKDRIYMGVSRGAAATFSALATLESTENIKLCILEGPPSSMSGIFKYYGGNWFGSRSFGKWVYQNFATLFLGKQHKTDASAQPRGHVDTFPDHIPLLIVSSKKDSTVPHENSIRLALRVAVKRQQALDAGRLNVAPVYLLQLDSNNHDDYTKAGTEDSKCYQSVVHAICKKHNLPYIEEYAAQGESKMNAANLLGELSKPLIKLQAHFWSERSTRLSDREEAKAYIVREVASKREAQQELMKFQYSPLFYKPLPEVAIEQQPTVETARLSA